MEQVKAANAPQGWLGQINSCDFSFLGEVNNQVYEAGPGHKTNLPLTEGTYILSRYKTSQHFILQKT